MRLRSKLIVITAAASIAPIVAGALVGRGIVEKRSRAEFARLLDQGEHEVRAQYRQLQRELPLEVERRRRSLLQRPDLGQGGVRRLL